MSSRYQEPKNMNIEWKAPRTFYENRHIENFHCQPSPYQNQTTYSQRVFPQYSQQQYQYSQVSTNLPFQSPQKQGKEFKSILTSSELQQLISEIEKTDSTISDVDPYQNRQFLISSPFPNLTTFRMELPSIPNEHKELDLEFGYSTSNYSKSQASTPTQYNSTFQSNPQLPNQYESYQNSQISYINQQNIPIQHNIYSQDMRQVPYANISMQPYQNMPQNIPQNISYQTVPNQNIVTNPNSGAKIRRNRAPRRRRESSNKKNQ